ncbi:MAG: hypothetical protein H6557_35570 [Lewinellaceae bacterium]|nr:hypothetical protein [Phaeodactylibacter sp.]MCB9041966.1 hypothetical protein [Lewinellaceae bacterium]
MKYLSTIVLLCLAIGSFSQANPEYYRFPNTYLFIQPPNDSFSSMDDLVGLTTGGQSSYIRAENFTLEEEPMIDQFYLNDFNADEFEERKIEGGRLKYAWKKALAPIHPDSIFVYAAKVYVSDQSNYVVLGFQKNLEEKTREQILKSIINMKVDTAQKLGPFTGKSFKVDLDIIPLKYCEAFNSDWMVKLTSDGAEFPAGEDKSSILLYAHPYSVDDLDGMASAEAGVEIVRKEELANEPGNWAKYVLRMVENEGVALYDYYYTSSGKMYQIKARIYPASSITEGQVDEFVRTFEVNN